MTDLIRSACLTHYAEVARSVGLEPAKMLRKAKLPLACLNDQNMRVAVGSVRRLLEISAAEAGVEDFALRIAGRGSLGTLGPVGLVVREQPTVRAAIEALARFIHIHDEAMRLEIEHGRELITIGFRLRGATRQSTELAIGRVHAIIRFLFSGDWRPARSLFHAFATTPPPKPPAILRLQCHLQCRTRRDSIGRERSGLSDQVGKSDDGALSAKQGRIDQGPARTLGRQSRGIGLLTAAQRPLHDRTCRRISRLRSAHRPSTPSRLRHELFRHFERAACKARDAVDRG